MLYHKIPTVFERDPHTHKVLTDTYTNPIFSLIKEWEFTEKIDGTNIRIEYRGDIEDFPEYPQGWFTIGGKEDNSEISPQITDYINGIVKVEKLHELFEGKQVTIFGEGYGGKIQAGREDKLRGGKYSDREKFIVFDICVGSKYWLKRSHIEDICQKLRLDIVPLLLFPLPTLTEAIAQTKIGFISFLGNGNIKAEGIIGKPPIPLFDAKHRRIICKMKTKDFG